MLSHRGGHGEALTPVELALSVLLSRVALTPVERVPIGSACGRVIAEPVTSQRSLPGCDNSSMDGYAVHAADCAGAASDAPVVLPVVGEARAGEVAAELTAGTAMAIATGSPLPGQADAVVPVEDTRRHGDRVAIHTAVRPGAYVRGAGGDVRPGTVMVPAGRRLRPVDIAACAAVGATTVAVRRRPRVVILGGGDELVPVEVEPASHQVVDSNSLMLAAAVVAAGGEALPRGVMADDRHSVRRHVAEAAAAADLVITSAGVSVGAHDHVRSVVDELGHVLVWRVAMRPGKPVLIGAVAGTCVLGLPGNPVSSAVTFELFGRPAVLALQGADTPQRRRIAVRMGEAVSVPVDLQTHLRVRLEAGADPLPVAWLSGHQGSSMLRSLGDADALAIVPAGVGEVAAGTVVAALELC